MSPAAGLLTLSSASAAGISGQWPGFTAGVVAAAAPAARQAPGPANAAAAPRAGRGGFGGPIVLGPDDRRAFPDAPAGFDMRREEIPRGRLLHLFVQRVFRQLGK